MLLQPRQKALSDPRSGVGGRLTFFSKEWAKVTENPFVLKVIKEGFRLEFNVSPPQRFFLTHLLRDQEKPQGMLGLISLWKSEGVISPVLKDQKFQGFYSHVFLVRKASGGFWTVINLSLLNSFLVYRRFHMESIYSLRNRLLPEVFIVTLDLQDAYLHVPIYRIIRSGSS